MAHRDRLWARPKADADAPPYRGRPWLASVERAPEPPPPPPPPPPKKSHRRAIVGSLVAALAGVAVVAAVLIFAGSGASNNAKPLAAAAGGGSDDIDALREEVDRVSESLGRRLKILVGKPGLDGHSNGAEQIAVRARDVGMDVVYDGIRLTPAQIAKSALDEGVHVIGLSILSGSHRELIPSVMDALREVGVDAPVVVGGIIPDADVEPLKAAGVAAVYTPKDFDITKIMGDVVTLVAERNGVASAA